MCDTVDRVKLASCYASCLDDELSCLLLFIWTLTFYLTVLLELETTDRMTIREHWRQMRFFFFFFFFGPTFDLEFSHTLVSKVKFDVFNPLLTDFTQRVSACRGGTTGSTRSSEMGSKLHC